MLSNSSFILPRKPAEFATALDRMRPSARSTRRWALWTIVLLLAGSLPAWAVVATTTTLGWSTKSVNSHAVTTLTAKVTPTTVTQGLVRFYDGNVLLGTGQLVTTGTKYVHGAAYLSVELGAGPHALKAVFAGTAAAGTSTSAVANITLPGGTTSTTISSSGSAGNYTLTSQVVANGPIAPTGSVNFLDQSGGNAQFASATLGASTVSNKFGSAAPYPIVDSANWYSYEAVVADFNGDGFLDMAEVEYSDAGIYLGTGSGTFQAVKPFCMTTAAVPVHCTLNSSNTIHAADFNSDGIPDLVTGEGSSLDVSLGKGDGTFQPPVHYAMASGGDGALVIADLNRDGIADIAQGVSDGVSVLIGNGDGSFQPHTDTGVTGPGSGYITAGDFNKDNIPDLAVTGWNSGAVAVLLGVGDGSFQAEKDTDIGVNPANPGYNPIVAADFKGTGYLADLAITGGNQVLVLIGKGDGTFPPEGDPAVQIYHPNGTFFEYQGGLGLGDWNNDGIQDIALTYYSSPADVGRVAVFWGIAGGTFNPTPKTINVGMQPVWVAGGDFNGDGTLDLATVNENDSTLSVVLNTATNTASATATGITVPGVGTQNVYAQYPGTSALASSTSSSIALTGNGVAVPLLTSMSPATRMAGGGAFTLTVTGANFVSGDIVKWNGMPRATAFVSATTLTASIVATDVANPATYPVRVATASGVNTGILPFTVTPLVVVPVITSISPATAGAGGPAFTLTVNGSNFIAGSVVKWNGVMRTTAFVSATQLTAVILATDIAAVGSYPVTVTNANGTSAPVAFTVTAPPALSSIWPSYAVTGGPAFPLVVYGANFQAGDVVKWNGLVRATTFVSSTKLTALIVQSDIGGAAAYPVTVMHANGATSNSYLFTVVHPPLAYGYFNSNGTPGKTSGNITCAWSAPEYLCTILGENFYFSNYVVNATIADINTPAMVSVNSISNKVIVKIYNPSGTAIQAPFFITVIKP